MNTLILGHRHHPPCTSCRIPMDWLVIFRQGAKPLEMTVCNKCHTPELRVISADGKEKKAYIKTDGALGLI